MALRDNLAAFWDLSEASGNRVDSVAGNDLAEHNTVTGTTGPGSHNASLLTATNQEWLDHIDNATLSAGNIDFTAVIWVNFVSFSQYLPIFSHWRSSTNQRSWVIMPNSSPTFILAVQASATGTTSTTLNSTTTPTTGNWYWVLFQHDSANDTIGIQVNNGTLTTTPWDANGLFDSSAAIEIGAENGAAPFLNGAVAMAGIWKRLLTADEKTTLYNSGNGLNYAEMATETPLTVTLSDTYALYR